MTNPETSAPTPPEPSDDPDWLDWLADAIAEEWEDEAV